MTRMDQIRMYMDKLSSLYPSYVIKSFLRETIGTTDIKTLTEEQYVALLSTLESHILFASKCKSALSCTKNSSKETKSIKDRENPQPIVKQTMKIITEIDQNGKFLCTRVAYNDLGNDNEL